MATVLDVGLIQYFDVIYPVVLVFALVFAILQKTKALGAIKALDAVVAIVVAFTILLSRSIIDLINFMIPWFTIAIIFFVMLLLIFQVFGAKEENIFEYMKGDKAVGWTIVGIAIVIMVAAGANVFGQDLVVAGGYATGEINETSGVATTDFETNIYATLFHPKVLGLIVLFGIAIFAVALLSSG